jgi:hypothetical protein
MELYYNKHVMYFLIVGHMELLHVYYNTTLYDLQLEKHYMFIIIQLNMIYN